MSDCRPYQVLLTACVDGQLAAADRPLLERHLRECARCQADMQAGAAARHLLRARAGACDRLEMLTWRPRRARLGRRSLLMPAAAASTIIAAAVLITLTSRPAAVEATGTIGDSNCGAAHHTAYGNDLRTCTLNCVRRGAEFILVVDGEVYQIGNQSFGDLAAFASLRVSVRGTMQGRTITLSHVAPASADSASMAANHATSMDGFQPDHRSSADGFHPAHAVAHVSARTAID